MALYLKTYAAVLQSLKALVDADTDGSTTGKVAVLRVYLRRAIREYWRKFWWPELMLVEQRLYRPEYDASTAYAALDEVFYWPTRKYYICTTASTGNAPADSAGVVDTTYWAEAQTTYSGTDWAASTVYAVGDIVRNIYDGDFYQCHTGHTSSSSFDSTKFTLLTPFVRSIQVDQSGQTEIGDLEGAYDDNPDVFPETAGRIRHGRRGDDIIIRENYSVVWLRFRKRVPAFLGDDYDSSTAYSAGDTIWYNATDFYTANQSTSAGQTPDTHPAKWDVNPVPERLSECVAQRAYAEYLFAAEGRSERALAQDRVARRMVNSEWEELRSGEGISNRLPVRTP